LKSVSRSAQGVLTAEEYELAREARALAAEFEDTREMLKIGAYRRGANAATDAAIDYHARLEALLSQPEGHAVDVAETFDALRAIAPRRAGSAAA
jgi:flagellum-specific ATP synthase